ncbi:MAG: sensor histidine kinase [Niabella sp.]
MILQLPFELKLTYAIAVTIMMLFAGFIIFVVFAYNKRQLVNRQQAQLKEAEYANLLLQKELERQKSIEQERERISCDMHDDLGAGISAIKLHAEFLRRKLDGKEELLSDIDELLKTSQEMNLSMREMLWSLNSNKDTVGNMVQYIASYAEGFFNRSDITYTLETGGIISNTVITTPRRRHFFLCIKEALNNVYKHSKATTVQLQCFQDNNHLITDVIDNGIGFSSISNSGNGMENMRRRMKQINGSFQIVPTTTGIHIKFILPLS